MAGPFRSRSQTIRPLLPCLIIKRGGEGSSVKVAACDLFIDTNQIAASVRMFRLPVRPFLETLISIGLNPACGFDLRVRHACPNTGPDRPEQPLAFLKVAAIAADARRLRPVRERHPHCQFGRPTGTPDCFSIRPIGSPFQNLWKSPGAVSPAISVGRK
jgi:hypothetical protein